MKEIFDGCVLILQGLARLCGLTYEEINVVIFCGIWPVMTILLVAAAWWYRSRCLLWKRDCEEAIRLLHKEGLHDHVDGKR